LDRKDDILRMTPRQLNVTRGSGLFERFLADKRISLANKLIPDSHWQGRILDIGCGEFPYFLLNMTFS
jgi:hypothetical protein